MKWLLKEQNLYQHSRPKPTI